MTGGASGLGRGTIEYLHRSGSKVALLDLPASSGAELAQKLGENALFVPADVGFFVKSFAFLMEDWIVCYLCFCMRFSDAKY